MKLSCYIIDDEPLAIEVLENYVSSFEGLCCTGTFQNPVKAFQKLHEATVDLIFIDIEMPELTGIEFIKSLKHPPMIIFTTAYRDYALAGYELDVVDYLLKPISFERFLQAMSKVLKQKIAFKEKQKGKPGGGSLIIQSEQRTIKIPQERICYIESQRNKVRIILETETVDIYKTMDAMEKELADKGFLRVHRSFIVSLDKIKSWTGREVEIEGYSIPIGRSFARTVKDKLEKSNSKS